LVGCVITKVVLGSIIIIIIHFINNFIVFDFVVFLQLKGFKDLSFFQYYPVRYSDVGR